jgi:hypothetical protein
MHRYRPLCDRNFKGSHNFAVVVIVTMFVLLFFAVTIVLDITTIFRAFNGHVTGRCLLVSGGINFVDFEWIVEQFRGDFWILSAPARTSEI